MKKYNGIRIGNNYQWETWEGNKYSGAITEFDGDCMYVRCRDGITRCVHLESGVVVEERTKFR